MSKPLYSPDFSRQLNDILKRIQNLELANYKETSGDANIALSDTRDMASYDILSTSSTEYYSIDFEFTADSSFIINFSSELSNENSGANRIATVRFLLNGIYIDNEFTVDCLWQSGVSWGTFVSHTAMLDNLSGGTYTLSVEFRASAAASIALRHGCLTIINV